MIGQMQIQRMTDKDEVWEERSPTKGWLMRKRCVRIEICKVGWGYGEKGDVPVERAYEI